MARGFGKNKKHHGGKGRGKGSRKRRREYIDASDEEGKGNAANAGKGSNKGKRGQKQLERRARAVVVSSVVEPPLEDPQPLVSQGKEKRSRPGFHALLSSLGVQEDSEPSISDSEDDDNDLVEASDDEKGEDGDGDERKDDEVAKDGEGVEEEGEEEEQQEHDEDTEASMSEGEIGAEEATGRCEGLDFYPMFWEEASITQTQQRGGATSSSEKSQFQLQGLDRCEAKGCQADTFKALMEVAAAGVDAWKKCGLAPGLQAAFEAFLEKENLELSAKEAAFFVFLHGYVDVAFPQHTHMNGRVVRAFYMLHVVDHIIKATTEIQRNTFKSNKKKRMGGGGDLDKDAPADSGFTKARVLVLCPTKSACYELVKTLLALCPSKKEVSNKSRFEDDFGPDPEDEDDNTKPLDWQYIFTGKSDDVCRIGIAVGRKQMRLYSRFDRSDIIFCTPLGLRKITGAEGDFKRDFDFLSSIEVCIIDRADALKMQNWEHVAEVVAVVNQKPQHLAGVDITRLRRAFAEGRARCFRQTVVTSHGHSLDADSIFCTVAGATTGAKANGEGTLAKKFGLGKLKSSKGTPASRRWSHEWDSDAEDDEERQVVAMAGEAAVAAASSRGCRGLVRLMASPDGGPLQHCTALGVSRQFYLHVACDKILEHGNRLFEAFEARYWRPLGQNLERLLVVVNSYHSFLRIRRFLRESGASFSSAFEYSSSKSLGQARYKFFHGESKLLLVTERFLWYRRYKLKGADYVLFFGPPETPQIYEEVLSHTRTPSQCNSMCLFTKFDALALERLVGQDRGRMMLASEPGKVFVYS